MKNFKRILAVIMAILVATIALSACGGDKVKVGKNAKDNMKTPDGAVKGFISSVFDADFKAAAKYVSSESEAYKSLNDLADFDTLIEKEDLSDEEKKIAKFAYKKAIEYIPQVTGIIPYSVGKAEIKGDVAEVAVELPIPAENYEPSQKFQETLMGIMMKNAGLVMSLQQSMQNVDFDDPMDVIKNLDVEAITNAIDKVLPEVLDAAKAEIENIEKSAVTVILEKEGSEWKILEIEE